MGKMKTDAERVWTKRASEVLADEPDGVSLEKEVNASED